MAFSQPTPPAGRGKASLPFEEEFAGVLEAVPEPVAGAFRLCERGVNGARGAAGCDRSAGPFRTPSCCLCRSGTSRNRNNAGRCAVFRLGSRRAPCRTPRASETGDRAPRGRTRRTSGTCRIPGTSGRSCRFQLSYLPPFCLALVPFCSSYRLFQPDTGHKWVLQTHGSSLRLLPVRVPRELPPPEEANSERPGGVPPSEP